MVDPKLAEVFLVGLSLAVLGWSTDKGWRILRARPTTRVLSGVVFLIAIAANFARLSGLVSYPALVLALAAFCWANWLGRRVGSSGRRYRVMLAYQRLLRLWKERGSTDVADKARSILHELPGDRDRATEALIDVMLETWPELLLSGPLDDSRTSDADRINRATERMNREVNRLFSGRSEET